MSMGVPSRSLTSSCKAVMPWALPAILKSMSPKWSGSICIERGYGLR